MITRVILFLSFCMLSYVSYSQQWTLSDIEIYDTYDDLEPHFQLQGDSIHVINFWATWCKPCIAELPYFEDLIDMKFEVPVKVSLISLDFENQIETKLLTFLNEEEIKSDVMVLTDGRFNDFIDRVDPSWEGSIPATLFVAPHSKAFYEREFHNVSELTKILSTLK